MKTPPPSKPEPPPIDYEATELAILDHMGKLPLYAEHPPDLFEQVQARMKANETEGATSKKAEARILLERLPGLRDHVQSKTGKDPVVELAPSKKNEHPVPEDPHPFRGEWSTRRVQPPSEEFPIKITTSKETDHYIDHQGGFVGDPDVKLPSKKGPSK